MWEEEANGIRKEEEEALLDLIDQQTKNVQKLAKAIAYYTSKFEQKEKNLEELQQELARLRGRVNVATSTRYHVNDFNPVKVERRSMSPIQISDDSSASLSECEPQPDKDNILPLKKSSTLDKKMPSPFQKNNDNSGKLSRAKPLLIIPDVKPMVSLPLKTVESSPIPCCSDSCAGMSVFSFRNTRIVRSKADISAKTPPDIGAVEIQCKGTKRKSEHKELIPLIGRSSSANTLNCQTCSVMHSQHKRKMRTIVLCPTDDQLFASSSLDGVVNLWQVQDRGSSANLLSSIDCFTRKCRRWPEDVAWHPEGGSLFSVYSADDGDSQISIMNLNKGKENMQVYFLEEKPHVKGIINNIMFMPWEEGCFVTGGSDHAVVLWTDKDGEQSWKPKELHRGHSSAVMGVAGLQHKKVVMSAGADKRILGIPGLMPIPFSVLLANLQTAAHLTPASSPNVDGPKFPEEYLVVPQRANEESALVLVTTRVEAEERRKHPGADHAALETDQAGKRRRIEGKECPEREAPSVKIEKLLSLGPEPEKGSDVTQEIEKVLPSVPPPEPKYQLHRTSSPLLASSFMYK